MAQRQSPQTQQQQQPHAQTVLWLDVSEDPALSRVCVAPRDIFELPVEYEDDRLANGMGCSLRHGG
jgi:hypothetical protein